MRSSVLFFVLLAGLAAACSKAPEAPKAEASDATAATITGDSLTVDAKVSEIGWIGTKVTGRHNGTINLKSGHFLTQGDSIVGGHFVLDMTSITDLDLKGEWKTKLEGHLKSPDFFAVDSFPTATFVVTKLERAAAGDSASHRVSGNLTLRGVTKQISFPATLKATGTADGRLEAMARFNLNRKDFGVAYTGKQDDLIADAINLSLNLVSAPRMAAK